MLSLRGPQSWLISLPQALIQRNKSHMTGPRGRAHEGESVVQRDDFVRHWPPLLRDRGGGVPRIYTGVLVRVSVKRSEAHGVWPALL